MTHVLIVPVLVQVDAKDRYTVRSVSEPSRRATSLSLTEALDTVELEWMEAGPTLTPEQLVDAQVRPTLRLRKVKVTAKLTCRGEDTPTEWTGRLPVVIDKQPALSKWIARLPTVSGARFPVVGLSELTDAVTAHLQEIAPTLSRAQLGGATVSRDDYLDLLEVEMELPTVLSSRQRPRKKTPEKTTSPANTARTFVPPTTLRSVCDNLTQRALDGRLPPTSGRETEVQQILEYLARPGGSVLLVGPSGVGKTAIIHEVVRRLGSTTARLTERQDIWRVDSNRLISGMAMVGAWEARVTSLCEELSARQEILVVDDLPNLVYAGRSASSETHIAGFLEPSLGRKEIRLLGECTPERLEAAREVCPGFFQHLQVVQVTELGQSEVVRVLVGEVRAVEREREAVVRSEVIDAILALTRRFQARAVEPGRSVRLMRRLLSEVRPTKQDAMGRSVYRRDDVVQLYQELTGLPPFVLGDQSHRRPEQIQSWFAERVIGQSGVAQVCTDLVCGLQQGLNDPDKPLATWMFVGPTGVGKTESAKALATYLFGRPDRLICFDMSEFRGPASIGRLVGGLHQPDGELTRAVSEQPFSVVLFDEIEKAHPVMFDVLLQVMGEGRLTNAAGRVTDFCNAIVILTSNLGVQAAGQRVGFGSLEGTAEDAHYRDAAAGFFRPEFFNRLDRVVPFRSLSREHVVPLVQRLVLTLLQRRGLQRTSTVVWVEPEVLDRVIELGFDPAYGARALKRTLESQLTVPLARELVASRRSQLTLVEVVSTSEGLSLHVVPVESAPSTALPQQAQPKDWAGIEQLYQHTVEGLTALEQSAIYGERIEAGFGTEAQAVLISEIKNGRSRLQDALWTFEQDELASFRFEEQVEVEEMGYHRFWGPRQRAMVRTKVIPQERARACERAGKRMICLWRGYRELACGVTALGSPWDHQTVVVLRPAVRHQHCPLTAAVCESLRDLVSLPGAPAFLWVLGPKGWAAVSSLANVAQVQAAAIVSVLPELSHRLASQVGWIADVVEEGPARHTYLVELSLHEPPGPVTAQWLSDVDAQADIQRRAARQEDPRPLALRGRRETAVENWRVAVYDDPSPLAGGD